MIDTLLVEVRSHGWGFFPFHGEEERVEVYDEKSFVTSNDCRSSLCYGGGVDLNHLLRWSVATCGPSSSGRFPVRVMKGRRRGRASTVTAGRTSG
jgi:hypothetical protein